MGAINIAIPFALITWAERSVDSSLAAILTSPVPLFAAILAMFFLPDEPIRVNGLAGLASASSASSSSSLRDSRGPVAT